MMSSSPPSDGDYLRARLGQQLLVPIPVLLLDQEASIGQEQRQRMRVKEPQGTSTEPWLVPAGTAESNCERNDTDFEDITSGR